jgi:serine protease AprX
MAESKWLNALHVRGTIIDISALLNLSSVLYIDFADADLNIPVPPDRLSNSIIETNKRTKSKLEIAVNYNYGAAASQVEMLGADYLHQNDFLGDGITIAVMDSGFPGVNTVSPFAQLQNNNRIKGGYNYPDRSPNFYTRHYHGTAVLSTMGGFVDGELVGTAPNADYYLFITEDSTSENPVEESYWVEAVERADSLGVDMINTSLGYFGYDNPNYSHTYSKMNGVTAFASRAASMIAQKGMILVTSAGNSGNSNNPHIAVPADGKNILTIGAVNANEVLASFSSIGPSFDNRIKPELAAQGVSAIFSNENGNIVSGNGTSFSSPILCGAIASFWSAFPNLTALEVMQKVKESADQYTQPDNFKGYGIPNFVTLLNAMNPEIFQVNTYPNPADDYITLTKNNTLLATFQLFDVLGRRVDEIKFSSLNYTLNTSSLTTGTYFYKMSINETTKTGKISIK